MQKGINFTEVLHVMWFSLVLWFDITHTHTKTSHLLCAQSSCLYYNEVIVYWHQKFTLQSFIMALLFKNYSLIEVMYLLIRFNKTRCFPQNTKNTAKNGTNKQHTHTHTHTHTLTQRKRKITLVDQFYDFINWLNKN